MDQNRTGNTYAYANGSSANNWGYMISRDKAAAPNFDQLCRGLAQIIRNLEPKHDVDLSPTRLAAFYRSVGGNYDELFHKTGEHGLSFLYRTLGCYHSLQPTSDAFQTPSIPCLTDDGFVRWQTLQMLLDPDVHAALMQKAVEVYDVPKSSGGTFPKSIPRECFPPRPDKPMEQWHRFVTSQINQESYMRRLKYSPYQSPHGEGNDSPNGYFARGMPQNKPLHGSRRESLHEERARIEEMRRRSSVPNAPSPDVPDAASPYQRTMPHSPRSHSENRPGTSGSASSQHLRNRSNTYNTSQSTLDQKSPSNITARRPPHRSDRRGPHHDRSRPSASRDLDSADDASSEESQHSRRNRSSGDEGKRKSRWASSLMPSFFLSSSKRRHSSDGRAPVAKNGERSPRRDNSLHKNKPGKYLEANPDRGPRVSFKGNVFSEGDLPLSTNEPPQPTYVPPPTAYRHSEPQPVHLGRLDSAPNYAYQPPGGFESDNQIFMRTNGSPARVNTVSGVNGRRYASTEGRNIATGRRRDNSVRHSMASAM